MPTSQEESHSEEQIHAIHSQKAETASQNDPPRMNRYSLDRSQRAVKAPN